jgi:hypothetical protein
LLQLCFLLLLPCYRNVSSVICCYRPVILGILSSTNYVVNQVKLKKLLAELKI